MFAYNTKDKFALLFGGANEKEVLSETWIYKDSHWRKINGKNPPARTFGSLVYDAGSDCFILFGGNKVLFGPDTLGNGFLLSDTWIFKNNKWEKAITKTSPQPRSEAAMCYDEVRKKTVLFGGYQFTENGLNNVKLGDTWEYDGIDWVKVSSSGPSPRSGAAMVFNRETNTCLLFGGSRPGANDNTQLFNGPAWQWDGKTWQEIQTEAPYVFNPCMAYDLNKGFVLRFGGVNNGTRVNTTWMFAGDKWVLLSTTLSPPARNHSALIYDSEKKGFFLFGGHDGENVFGDLWFFQNGTWLNITNRKPLKRVDNKH